MATAITSYPTQANLAQANPAQQENTTSTTGFLRDLADDIRTTGDQLRGKVQSDLFHKHLLLLANCYLALIVLLLSGMVPFLYFMNYFL